MTLETIILAALTLAVLSVLPIWPYSRDWDYWPAIFIGVVLSMLVLMTAFGWVPR